MPSLMLIMLIILLIMLSILLIVLSIMLIMLSIMLIMLSIMLMHEKLSVQRLFAEKLQSYEASVEPPRQYATPGGGHFQPTVEGIH